MIILGGLGSIWESRWERSCGSWSTAYLSRKRLNDKAQSWCNFALTAVSFSIFGFILVMVMLIRPEGHLAERGASLELRERIGVGEGDSGRRRRVHA